MSTDVRHRGRAHRHPWMSRIRLLYRIDRQRPDRVDAQFVDDTPTRGLARVSPRGTYSSSCLFHRACDSRAEHVQSSRDIRAEMHAERATFTLDQDREVPARLRRLDHTERILLTRDRDVPGIVAGDLEEDTAVRTAFVGLTAIGSISPRRSMS